MPANETPERLAAAAWIEYLVFDQTPQLGLRAQLSCQNRLITTTFQAGSGTASFVEAPLVILPFDREFTRRECTVIAQFIQTIEPLNRVDYPFYSPNGAEFSDMTVPPDTRLLYCPMHLDWLGDPANPSWLPFALSGGGGNPGAVPPGFDVDLFNAVALCPRGFDDNGDYVAQSGDIVVHVFKHPPVPADVQTVIEDVIEIVIGV